VQFAWGVPAVKDRVVQTALCQLRMPVFEADFHPRAYGFRPKRRAHQAIAEIQKAVPQGYVEIIDADLSKYFDPIPHRGRMRAVVRRVSDGSVLRLVKSWWRAPVVEIDADGTRRALPNRCGTPQGGVIPPLLANLYLNPLDHGVNDPTAGQARPSSQNRLRRWLWRKHGGHRNLWKYYLAEQLHTRYGLYGLPLTARWKAVR
jgi:retron-type reverse transcriptase